MHCWLVTVYILITTCYKKDLKGAPNKQPRMHWAYEIIWVIHVMRLFLPIDWWRLAHGSLILAFVDTISNYQLPELPMYGNDPDNLLNIFRAWHMHCMYRPNKAKDAKLLKFFENQRPAWRLRTLLLSWKAHPDTFGAFPSTKCDVCCGWNQMKHAGTHRRSKRDQKSTFFFNFLFFPF